MLQISGIRISDYVTIPVPISTTTEKNTIEGEIIHIDRFGNLMTNIEGQMIEDLYGNYPERDLKVVIRGMEAPIKKYYSEGDKKRLYSLTNSFGYLELFVNKGSASCEFRYYSSAKR